MKPNNETLQENRTEVLKILENIRKEIACNGLTYAEYQAILVLKHFIELMYDQTNRDMTHKFSNEVWNE